MENFQQRFLRAKELSGLRWIDIAKKSGLDKASISQYKNGIHVPEPDALYKLATALNVSMEWLNGADISITAATDEQLLNRYHRLSDVGKTEFTQFLDDLLSRESIRR